MYWAGVYLTGRRSGLEETLSIRRDLGDPNTIATAFRNLALLRANLEEKTLHR